MAQASTIADSYIETKLTEAGTVTAPRPRASLLACVQWSVVGTVFYSACQWAILIVLAKLGSTELVGQFALGLAITAPIILFANLQLSSLQATDAKGEYRFGHYLALRLITTTLALAGIAGLIYGVGYAPVTAWVVMAVGVAKAFEAISDVYHGLMQRHHRMERIAWSQMLKGTISVIVVTAWIALGGGIIGAAIALAVIWGSLLFLYDIPSTTWLRHRDASCDTTNFAPTWDWGMLGRLAWSALPLGVCTILNALSFNIPRYLVEYQLGVEQLGIFAALAYVSVLGQMLSVTIGQAAAPRMANYYAAGNLRSLRLLVLILAIAGAAIGLGGVLVAWFAGRPLLTLLYRAEYAEYTAEFVSIMAGAGLWCVATMFYYSATATRRQRKQAQASVFVVLAALVSSVALIPYFGLTGAAAAVAVSGAVAFLSFGFIFFTIRHPEPAMEGP